MARYPSINEDALKTLPERLRDAKAELRHAADAVADADAHSASAAEAADALRSEAAETRGERRLRRRRDARAEPKLVAKMSRRREEAERTREAAEEGARDAEAAARAERPASRRAWRASATGCV